MNISLHNIQCMLFCKDKDKFCQVYKFRVEKQSFSKCGKGLVQFFMNRCLVFMLVYCCF